MKQQRTKTKLENDELSFFYDLLYQYEKEDNHKGYDFRYIDKSVRSMISLNHKQKNVTKPKTKNTINYKGGVIIPDLLRHVRNAFAHCNIESVEGSMIFTFYDEYRGECTMSGSMDKAVFYKLIKEIKKNKKK